MSRTTSFRFLLAAAFVVLLAAAFGQGFYGSIVGTVMDQGNAIIAGATVTLTNTGTSERRTMMTAADGSYQFVNLVPGNYRIEVEQAGFKRYTRDQIAVTVEGASRIEVVMQIGDTTQSIEVAATAPLMQTENASLSQVVSGRSVDELPLNGRNVLNLVQMVPGVVPQGSSSGSLTGKNLFSAGNFQIGGGTSNQSAFYYDGVSMNAAWGNAIALVPSQDSVSEFRVQTNNTSAEYGRYTGGVVNLTSKSGTNNFHGSLYEYLRNRVLNASTFFANAQGTGKPAFTQNQFGGNLGGPIKRDKIFFYAGYEGYRQRQGQTFIQTVPTAAMLQGDFSNYRDSSGNLIPIYDPQTQCGAYGNGACGSGTAQRTPFPNNVIPLSRINPVSLKFVDFPAWGLPTGPGNAAGNFNFAKNATTGGDNDQLNLRGDYNMTQYNRILARFTRWTSLNTPVNLYGNGQRYGDPYSPEAFTTDQAVLADTYSISPTTVLDVRLGFMRWFVHREPGNFGIDISKTFGLPAYFDQLPALDGINPVTTPPYIGATGYDFLWSGPILARDNNYSITPSLIKIVGRHTWTFGAELGRGDNNYYQSNLPGGQYSFSNVFTSRNALNPGATGNSIASFLLGDMASFSITTQGWTAASARYQAYYVNDTWQLNSRTTVNLGLRWEIPGVYTERFDRLASFDPTAPNPVLQQAGVSLNGQPVLGSFVLADTPGHPERGLRPEDFHLFAPRAGIAYRLRTTTVIRAGAGIFFIPINLNYPEGPYGNPVNALTQNANGSVDNQVTVGNTIDNPLPNGILPPPGRNPVFQQELLGTSPRAEVQNVGFGYTGQWNFTIQQQLPGNLAIEASYSGLRGIHLPLNYQRDAIPTSLLSLGSQLQQQVANPFSAIISSGTLSQPTVTRGQLLLPFPEYLSLSDSTYMGDSSYNSLQLKAEKRFKSGGLLLASYTFSKILTDTETVTSWLDAALGGVNSVQNWYNLRGEKALSNYDARQRLTVSFVLDAPIGAGHKLLGNVHGVVGKVISGWGADALASFQDGFPLGLLATPNLTGYNTGLRPNVMAGCQKQINGPAQARLTEWFNTSCFTVPTIYNFGNESRTDPVLRGPGIANYDFAVFKRTAVRERVSLEFRTEFFNLFNRVQFGPPVTTETTAANSTFGQVTTQVNNPRLIQMALRLGF